MLQRIIDFLEQRMESSAVYPYPFERKHVAVAALLVEASKLDGNVDATEQGAIVRIIRETLKLPPEQARALVALAEQREAGTTHDWIFCRAINRGYTVEERIGILEKIREITLADGQLHRLEAMMLERVAGELELPPADIDRIRSATGQS
jgi:uncharacterized tellurite resistance protein B-like protein